MSLKLCSITKDLREMGYNDSQSTSKTDKQNKENLKCVYQLIRRVKDRKNGQSGKNDYKKIAQIINAQLYSTYRILQQVLRLSSTSFLNHLHLSRV